MAFTYTTGPWKVCREAPNPYWTANRTVGSADPNDGRRILDIFDGGGSLDREDIEGNAVLAAAAPELYEALKALLSSLDPQNLYVPQRQIEEAQTAKALLARIEASAKPEALGGNGMLDG